MAAVTRTLARRRLLLVVWLAAELGTASCSSGGASTPPSPGAATPASSPGTSVPATASGASGTVWLCRPGMADNPCAYSPAATALEASGAAKPATLAGLAPTGAASSFDCFYVYPTVSEQQAANASLTIMRPELVAAVEQASLFSQVCGVWAPMYRQATAQSIATGLSGGPGALSVLSSTFTVAYDSLLSGWQDFLAHDDNGRPIILIGDSQGSAILIHLIATQVDHDPALLGRLVVAIIAGGNLQVPDGQVVGATFTHVPLCTSAAQTGCVIAYSSYPSQPPPASLFGRAGQGVSLQSGQTARSGEQVACVNPAALGGGTADLSPYFLSPTQAGLPPAVRTPWVTYPDLYSAACQSKGGATWLQVSDIAGPGDTRPVVSETLGPAWGYHVDDVGLALGDLVRDVAGQEAAWATAHH
jgi:hypothetical protein